MKPQDNTLVAAALVFKLNRFAQELEANPSKTQSDKRHLLAIKTLALIQEDRVRTDKARKLNSRF